MLGMNSSLSYLNELPGDAAVKDKPADIKKNNLRKIIQEFSSREIDYWVNAMDAFYAKPSNSGVNYATAFWTVLLDAALNKK